MAKVTQSFNAEIQQLLNLMIHSLYSQKEIFLRELISNGSDALDKLKFQSLTQDGLLPSGYEPQLSIEADPTTKTLKISDNGIGMDEAEVVEYLGTIAKSGTKAFAQLSQEMKSKPELIGQFGVGFYSSFMVADKVTVHTQKAGTAMGTLWESSGDGTYSIDQIPRADGFGTSITLHLKGATQESDSAEATTAEAQDFTDEWTLKSLVKKYSDFIAYPIRLKKIKTADKDESKKEETEDKKPDFEVVNSQKALWLKPSSEITAEEYKEFYKHVSHDWNDPLKTIHYKAEGTLEFTALLYLPGKKPWNYYTKEQEYGLQLYVKRVFIMADCKDLLPSYLRFVKGLVDSSDLSLNVSREILQQDRQVTQMRKGLQNKIISTLKDMLNKERSEYEKLWNEFGPTMKEGIPNDPSSKDKLQDLLLFKSTEGDGWVSLAEYVERMKPEQKEIYFLTGDNFEQLKKSPYLEKLKQKNYEVLLLVDPVDEWVATGLTEYKDKKLQSITQQDLELDSEEEKKQKEENRKGLQERFAALLDGLKKSLEKEVKDVVLSDRLTDTPACLVSGKNDPSAHMEKLMSRMGGGDMMGMGTGTSKRILELNPQHALVERMLLLPADKQALWGEILLGQALLVEGSALQDPVSFNQKIAQVMLGA
ncbi:MAG: molecular chaperone HtpG [Pseudobdellovibrionaceae bacterium]